jgi:hypothetical protein
MQSIHATVSNDIQRYAGLHAYPTRLNYSLLRFGFCDETVVIMQISVDKKLLKLHTSFPIEHT